MDPGSRGPARDRLGPSLRPGRDSPDETTAPMKIALWMLLCAAAPADDPARDVTIDGRRRARLLHLESGEVVRGRALLEDGVWDVDLGSRHIDVPAERVARVVLEADVQRRLRALERDLRGGADPRRTSLVRWLASEGLVTEALAHLDRILADEPDHARALELVHEPALAVRLAGAPAPGAPAHAARDAWLRLGARAKPSARELAIAELADDPDRPALFERLTTSLHDRSAARRRCAAVALRRLFPGDALEDLQGRAIFDVDDEVRRQAVLGLRREESDEVLKPFLRALESEVGIVRRQAIEALGLLGRASAVPSLVAHLTALNARAGAALKPPRAHIFTGRQIAYVMDYDVEIAQGASIADPIIGVLQEGNVLDVAAYGATIQRTVILEGQVLRGSLRELTGADPGRTDAAWLRWWREHEADWTGGAGAR